jgi:hypothetical protein
VRFPDIDEPIPALPEPDAIPVSGNAAPAAPVEKLLLLDPPQAASPMTVAPSATPVPAARSAVRFTILWSFHVKFRSG